MPYADMAGMVGDPGFGGIESAPCSFSASLSRNPVSNNFAAIHHPQSTVGLMVNQPLDHNFLSMGGRLPSTTLSSFDRHHLVTSRPADPLSSVAVNLETDNGDLARSRVYERK